MIQIALTLALTLQLTSQTPGNADQSSEARIVAYLRDQIRPGRPIVVSTLVNEVFTTDADRKVLNRLFDTFFKIPLFVVRAQKPDGRPPTLREISDQFAFTDPQTADVILSIMESDPRMPKFLERDRKTGEILHVDVDAILSHPSFGKAVERTLTGWEGKAAPDFLVKAYDGSDLSLATLRGKPFLLYFWFTNCPPCVTTTPLLADLDRTYASLGFTVIGLNADKVLELDYTDEERAAYARSRSIGFQLAHANEETQQAYGGVSTFPTLFFVNKAGIVVKELVSGQDRAALEEAIQQALK